MKLWKRFATLAVITVLVAVLSVPAGIAAVVANPTPHTLTINGKQVQVTGYNILGNNYYKLRDLGSRLNFGVAWDANSRTVIVNPSKGYADDVKGTAGAPARVLAKGNWAANTYNRLTKLINETGSSSASYDTANRPYAVFDFDNTSVINDVEEALLIYQLERLEFKIKPEQMKEVLETGIPDINQSCGEDYNNLTVDLLATDCANDYQVLYNNYQGFGSGGNKTLAEIQTTNEYKDFTTKVRYLYDAVNDTFDASVGYPWVTYLFTGMTSDEVYQLAAASDTYWAKYGSYTTVTWTSPSALPGKSGVVSVSYKTGLTFTSELTDLYNTLMANGIDVYVVSASFYDVVRAAACNPDFGYNLKPENLYAMMLKKDSSGRFINQYDDDYFQTQGKGKEYTINAFIRGKYGNRGPILVCGDSAGDYNMLTAYDDMQVGLLFNRYRKDSVKELSQIAAKTIGQTNAKYILQGRDENEGQLRPSEKSIMLGETTEVLVRD